MGTGMGLGMGKGMGWMVMELGLGMETRTRKVGRLGTQGDTGEKPLRKLHPIPCMYT